MLSKLTFASKRIHFLLKMKLRIILYRYKVMKYVLAIQNFFLLNENQNPMVS